MKYLIIAEKPSVATDLSKALAKHLGKFEKKGKTRDAQYFINGNAAITSAVGHLVELKMPTGPNGKNLPWNFKVLPAIPKKFEPQPFNKTAGPPNQPLALPKKKRLDVTITFCNSAGEVKRIFKTIWTTGKIKKQAKRP